MPAGVFYVLVYNMSEYPIVLVVAAALVDVRGRVLLARRPEGKSMAGLWEFPGGKVHAGETPENALVRELSEELSISVTEDDVEPAGFTSHRYPDFHLLMPLYLCRRWKGEIKALEHDSLEWAEIDRLEYYPMPDADVPLIGQLWKAVC